jgi:hypothetical protein
LLTLVAALDASPRTLRRDINDPDYAIRGSHGHIYPDGSGFSSAMLCGDRHTSSANGACVRQARQDSVGMRPVTAASG